jgi:hypothetical protein
MDGCCNHSTHELRPLHRSPSCYSSLRRLFPFLGQTEAIHGGDAAGEMLRHGAGDFVISCRFVDVFPPVETWSRALGLAGLPRHMRRGHAVRGQFWWFAACSGSVLLRCFVSLPWTAVETRRGGRKAPFLADLECAGACPVWWTRAPPTGLLRFLFVAPPWRR